MIFLQFFNDLGFVFALYFYQNLFKCYPCGFPYFNITIT